MASEAVARMTKGRSLAEIEADETLRSAVERKLEIVGEALSQIFRIDRVQAERITNARRIVDFRNVLIHAYADLNFELIADVPQNHVGVLDRELDEMLKEPIDP
ncbi:MAG: DUF86 domain-containing protein [Phycisphaerales bacterium]